MAQQGKTTRRTVQKEAVRKALAETPGFVSARRLHRQLDAEGSPVGLATVYRQLNALAASGDVDVVATGEEQLFRACGQHGHHHHLICEVCGDAVDVNPMDEEWLRRVAAEHGYTVARHTLEIYGRCPRCRAT